MRVCHDENTESSAMKYIEHNQQHGPTAWSECKLPKKCKACKLQSRYAQFHLSDQQFLFMAYYFKLNSIVDLVESLIFSIIFLYIQMFFYIL